MKISWTILGSSSGIASTERASPGHILSCDDRLFMFDCGSGATSSFLRSALEPDGLEAIIVSHTHADHISDLPMFVQMLYHAIEGRRVMLYLPSEAIAPISHYLDACYLFKEKLPFTLDFRSLDSEMDFLDGQITVRPIPNPHLNSNKKYVDVFGYSNLMQCYMFSMKVENKRIFYSADLLRIENIEDQLGNLDLLVVETTHIDLNHLPQMLAKNRVKKVVLTHIGDEELPAVREFADSVSSDSEIIIGEDNMTIEI